MGLCNNRMRARHEIANFIILLSVLPAFWFVINNDRTHRFSLCGLFGMGINDFDSTLVAAGLASIDVHGKLKHEIGQWIEFVDGHHFCTMDRHSKPQISTQQIPLQHYIDGTPVPKKTKTNFLHVIRIGHRQHTTPNKFSLQKSNGKLIQTPPHSNLRRAQQRTFARMMVPMIMEATCENVFAAVHCHVQIGCNVTHKVHLMWRHVVNQMKYVPGGLGEKMEDWVER